MQNTNFKISLMPFKTLKAPLTGAEEAMVEAGNIKPRFRSPVAQPRANQ